MLVFGCCVGPSGKFQTVAGPALAALMRADDILIREQGKDGICAAYNRVLEQARGIAGCEGVVLLHDDTELGPRARDQLLSALRKPNVGVVGAVGGSGLYGPQWVDARKRAGYTDDFYGWRRFGPSDADVDAVDGLLLAVSPRALRTLDFDSSAFPAFHGYDTDYCLQARQSGLRVVVAPVDHVHRDKGGVGDALAFENSARTLRSRWPDRIRPLGPVGQAWRSSRDASGQLAGRLRHTAMTSLKAAFAKER